MDLDDDELKATRKLNGADKYSEADEMFEKLGYEKIEKKELKHIRYKSECANAISENIWFHKVFEKIEIFYWDKKEKQEMTKPISMKELQAINKKCEELRMDIKSSSLVCNILLRRIK